MIERCLQVFSLEIRIGTERTFEFMNLDFSFGQPLRTSLQKTFEKLTLRHLAESAVQNCDEKFKKIVYFNVLNREIPDNNQQLPSATVIHSRDM